MRLLVAGGSLEQGLLSSRIKSLRVYRFVHKPVSAQRLKLFIDVANRPGEAVRAGSTQTVEVLRAPADADRGRNGISGRRNSIILIAAVIGLIGAAVWLVRPHAAGVSAVAPTRSNPDLDALIQQADQLFAQSHFVAIDGNSAADLYSKAMALDPSDARARSGLERSIDYGLREVETALTGGKLDEAEARIAALKVVAPRNARLEFLIAQLAREREHALTDASRRGAVEGRQAQAHRQMLLAQDALRRGALVDPTDDNALAYLRSAERLWPDEPQIGTVREALVARMLASAESDLSEQQVTEARRLLDAAGSLGAEPASLERLRRRADQITVEIASASKAQLATATTPASAAPAPAAAATPAAAEAAQAVATATAQSAAKADATNLSSGEASSTEPVPASRLQLQRRSDPEYPTRALVQRISGWVELEFTVGRDGSVGDIAVRAAAPSGVFEKSAIDALKHWRYLPVRRDGQAVEQRAWVRIRFTASEH